MKRIQMFRAALTAVFMLGVLLAEAGYAAASGPFGTFPGDWTGEGTIRFSDGTKERLRCKVNYTVPDTEAQALGLNFSCKSDNYAFDLTGNVESDPKGTITGQWAEASRNFGGTVNGKAMADRIRVHIASSGFSATLLLTTKEDRQVVSIESGGGGEEASAAITLRRK